ncbi:response regulator transcription factor [Xanthobacter sp. V3C-3]|uniref:response regulator n=1 Tax=Xanthobacter lutulentifluminis TaxID=3119935 RepID=UPI0037263AAD
MRVLLVEDNIRLSDLTAAALRAAGFAVDAVLTAEDAEAALSVSAFDAIILDLGLPDLDGMDLLERVRRRRLATPVLLLTARDGAVVAGLNGGADDFLRKPFNMEELIARIRALLRRPGVPMAAALREGNIELDTVTRQARVGDLPLALSRREAGALELLMRRAGTVITKSAMEEGLYGFGEEVSVNAIEVLVHRLRRKLSGAGAQMEIHTLRGIGYLLMERPQ